VPAVAGLFFQAFAKHFIKSLRQIRTPRSDRHGRVLKDNGIRLGVGWVEVQERILAAEQEIKGGGYAVDICWLFDFGEASYIYPRCRY